MTAKRISFKGELNTRVGVGNLLCLPGDTVLITRVRPRWLLMRCPCGCSEEISINLDERADKAWRLYHNDTAGLTLFPSVWRDTGCESHFVVWRNHILMFGDRYVENTSPISELDLDKLADRVLSVWPLERMASFVEVAYTLREIPWDVQEACRQLVRYGSLEEGQDKKRGWYRRA